MSAVKFPVGIIFIRVCECGLRFVDALFMITRFTVAYSFVKRDLQTANLHNRKWRWIIVIVALASGIGWFNFNKIFIVSLFVFSFFLV